MNSPHALDGRSGTPGFHPHLLREARTVQHMIGIHCSGKHAAAKTPCEDCVALLEYACRRLEACPFGDNKPVCDRCPVPCFDPVEREQVKRVMRYSGPRMIFAHPLLTLQHMVDKAVRRRKLTDLNPKID
jgi:hypothetical protein